MDIEQLRNYCLTLPQTQEAMPFDDSTLVFKIEGHIYLMVGLDNPTVINVKCDPDKAVELREQYFQITPAWHMNKRHWNSVRIDSSLPNAMICSMIEDSYNLVKTKNRRAPKKEAR